MTKLSTIAIVIALAGCGGGDKATKTTSTTPAPTAPASGGAVLGITDLKFYEGSDYGAQLHADGTFEIKQQSAWVKVGTITSDGKITGKDGKSIQVQPDGTVKASEGGPDDAGIKLDGDTLVMKGEDGEHRITLDAKGAVVFDGKPQPGDPSKALRVDGAKDVASRRTALLVLGLMVGASSRQPPPAAATAVPAKP